jgi:hypothetical protein
MNKVEVINHYIKSYNQFDVEAMLLNLDKDIVFINISNGLENLRTEGIEAFKNQAIIAKAYFNEREQLVKEIIGNEHTIEIQIEYNAVLAMDFPNGLKSGDKIKMNGKSIFKFEGNKIKEIIDIS